MNQWQRIDYIDIAKGIGMLTIIWGHINDGFTNLLVYSFHIPLFFFLSGLVFKKEKYSTFREFAIKRMKTLVIPYLLFSFLTWLVWVAYCLCAHINVDSFLMPLLQTFIAQGSQGFLVHNVPLWFVSCLLLIEFVFYFISKRGKEIVMIVVCALLAFISYVMEKNSSLFDFTLLPWSIGASFACVVFYGAGNILMSHGYMDKIRKNIKTNSLLAWIILAIMTLALIILAPLNGNISVGHEQYNNRFLFYLIGFWGIFCVVIYSILIEQYTTKKTFSWIKWIGQNSLFFLFVENPIKGFVIVVLGKIVHTNDEAISYSFGLSLIAFIISVLITMIIVKCLLMIKNIRKRKMIANL